MTIQEAIRSGKRFRRQNLPESDLYWCIPEEEYCLRAIDLLATDWITEEFDEPLKAWITPNGSISFEKQGTTGRLGYKRAPWLDEPGLK